MKKITVGVDASRNRSGGAISHLIGILDNFNPSLHDIESIHVWAYKSLLDKLPNHPWLIKHSTALLEKSLINQLFWQLVILPQEIKLYSCDILFSTDASTLSTFNPMVVLSQDMLSYEPGVMSYFGFTFARIRLLLILFLQNRSFKNACGVIFLTHYSGYIIQKSCGSLKNVAYIPHGVGDHFKRIRLSNEWPTISNRQIKCVYVSNIEMYKNQWTVIEALSLLKNRGYDLSICLVGSSSVSGRAQIQLNKSIKNSESSKLIIDQVDFIHNDQLPTFLASFDLFIFASSCENLPITLLEAMAVGLPIVCSNSGPMPEVLGDGGIYFNPRDVNSIANSIEKIIMQPELRASISSRAKILSYKYTWSSCSYKTFKFVSDTFFKSLK